MENLTKNLNKLDWTLTLAALCYGIYDYLTTQEYWWLAGGILGLIVTIINPSKHIQNYANKKIGKKQVSSQAELKPIPQTSALQTPEPHSAEPITTKTEYVPKNILDMTGYAYHKGRGMPH